MGPYNIPTDTDGGKALSFYNDVYDDISKFNIDKENAFSNVNVYKKTKMIFLILELNN